MVAAFSAANTSASVQPSRVAAVEGERPRSLRAHARTRPFTSRSAISFAVCLLGMAQRTPRDTLPARGRLPAGCHPKSGDNEYGYRIAGGLAVEALTALWAILH